MRELDWNFRGFTLHLRNILKVQIEVKTSWKCHCNTNSIWSSFRHYVSCKAEMISFGFQRVVLEPRQTHCNLRYILRVLETLINKSNAELKCDERHIH